MRSGTVRLFAASALLLAALSGVGSPARAQASEPASVTYAMRPGDTLADLGERFFVRPGDYLRVQRLNNIARDRRIPVGRVIRIPVALLRTAPAEARVVNLRGSASIAWRGAAQPAAVGQPVGEEAVIVTGPNAFLRLRMPDGSHVTLPSNSRARVARLRTVLLTGATDQDISLEAGRVETRAAPVGPGGGHRVTTPISVAAVRGTEFRSAFFPEGAAAAISVVEGAVTVLADGGEATAEAGEGVAVSPLGLARLPLLPAPSLPDLQLSQLAAEVVFRPGPTPGAALYRARLATDAGMIDAFAEQDSGPDGAIRFAELPDGEYFLRLTAVSPEGLEGRAATYAILRARTGVGGLAAAPAGAGRDRAYLFRWENEGGAPIEFRFQFRSSEGEAPPLFDAAGLTESHLRLTGLHPGDYAWRIAVVRYVAGRRLEVWSEPQHLRIGR